MIRTMGVVLYRCLRDTLASRGVKVHDVAEAIRVSPVDLHRLLQSETRSIGPGIATPPRVPIGFEEAAEPGG